MTNLRKHAENQPCYIRVPGYCCHDPARVVGCHVRMIGISGAGMKAEDLLLAYGCQPCHDVVDGRTQTEFTPDERRLMLLEGMVRTQLQLIREGLLKW